MPPNQTPLLAAPSDMVKRYTGGVVMWTEKTFAVSYRVSTRFKASLEAAATRKHRRQTNMLKTFFSRRCSAHGIDTAPTSAQDSSTDKSE